MAMHVLLYRRWLLIIGICGLVISLLCLVAFQITFPAVCIALTLVTIGLSTVYSYNNYPSNEGTGSHLSTHDVSNSDDTYSHTNSLLHSTDEASGFNHSPAAKTPSFRRPGAITSDRTRLVGLSGSSDQLNSEISASQRRRQERLGIDSGEGGGSFVAGINRTFPSFSSNDETLPNQQRIPFQPSSYIPEPSVLNRQTDYGTVATGKDTTTKVSQNAVGECSSRGAFSDSGFSGHPSSTSVVLPKFRRMTRSSVTGSGSFHSTDSAESSSSDLFAHPTHQQQYGSLGILPMVHLSKGSQVISDNNVARSSTSNHVTIRVAPPDPLKESPPPLVQSRNDSDLDPYSAARSDFLNSFSEKRKRTMQVDDDTFDTNNSSKRRKMNETTSDSGLSSYSSTWLNSADIGSLKRPALADVRLETEATAAKVRRLAQPAPVSSYSQPGAGARNLIDVSYSSSRRWLMRMGTPEGIYNFSRSQRPNIEEMSESEFRSWLRTRKTICKSLSESQMNRSEEETEDIREEPDSARSLMMSRSPYSRNSSRHSCSSDKGRPDDYSVSKTKASSSQSKQESISTSPMVSNYEVYLTAEDVEKDRHKEMERMKYMLGETCDLAEEARLQKQVVSADLCKSQSILSDMQQGSANSLVSDNDVVPVSSAASAENFKTTASAATDVMQPVSSCSESANSQVVSTVSLNVLAPGSSGQPCSASLSSASSMPPFTFTPPERSAGFETNSTSSEKFKFDAVSSKNDSSGFVNGLNSEASTKARPVHGGFKFPQSVTTAELGGFKLPQSVTTAEAGGFKFPQSVTTAEVGGFKFSNSVTAAEVAVSSASTNPTLNKGGFSFGGTKGTSTLSFGQPSSWRMDPATTTSAITTTVTSSMSFTLERPSLTIANSSLFTNAPVKTEFPTTVHDVSSDNLKFNSNLLHNQQTFSVTGNSLNPPVSSNFLVDNTRTEASKTSENATSVTTNFAGTFDCSASNSGATTTGVFGLKPSTSAGTASTYTSLSQSLFSNQFQSTDSPMNISNSQHKLASASTSAIVFGSQQKSSNDSGNTLTHGGIFGSGIRPTFGAQPTSTADATTRGASSFSLGGHPSLTANCFGAQTTTTLASPFGNQITTANLAGCVTSVNLFSNPQSSVDAVSVTASQVVNQTNSGATFSLLPSINAFKNQGSTSSNPFGSQMPSFNFGSQVASQSSFGGQPAGTFSFGNQATATNMQGNLTGGQSGLFGNFSSFNTSNAADSKPFGNLSSPGQFSCLSGSSAPLPTSNATFQFNQSLVTTSTTSNLTATSSSNPFNFGGQSSNPSFNFGQSSGAAFSAVQSSTVPAQQGQFSVQSGQFSTTPPFGSQLPWTPRFSLGTDSSNAVKNRQIKRGIRKR